MAVGPSQGLHRTARQAGPQDIQVPRPVSDPGVGVSAEDFGAAEGRALQSVAGGLNAIHDTYKRLEDKRQGVEDQIFRSRERSRLNQEYQLLLQKNPGASFEALTPQLDEARKRVREELLKEYKPSQDALRFADADAQNLTEQTSISVVRAHHNGRISKYSDALEETLTELERSVTINGGMDDAVKLYEDALSGFKGSLSEAQYKKALERGKKRLTSASGLWAISQIPDMPPEQVEAVLKHIRNPEDESEIGPLEQSIVDTVMESSPVDIIRIQSALNSRLSTYEDEVDKATDEIGNTAFKEGMLLAARGELTLEYVEANKDILSSSQLSQLSRIVAGGEAQTTNSAVYSDLLNRAVSDPDNVQREATQAYTSGLITRTDFNHLMTVTTGAVGDLPRYTSKVNDFIRWSLKPNEFDFSGTQARRQQDAILDFQAWIMEHPDATFEEARAQATQIVDNAKNSSRGANAGTIELPMGITVPPNMLTREHLQQARERVNQMRESDEISEQEWIRQGRLIMLWLQEVTE